MSGRTFTNLCRRKIRALSAFAVQGSFWAGAFKQKAVKEIKLFENNTEI